MILEIANDIEEVLKKEGLVGQRIGSGFCFLDNSRDVQFEYSSQEVKDYFSKIEEVIKKVSAQYADFGISLRFREDSFSFYVKPIEKPEDEDIDVDSYKRGWKDCMKEMMEKFKSLEDDIENM
ncbi:MAG: hypothetical protein IKK93_11515 [Campylobacter sp.]|nr:hypothetical protein [Campylobacter sp.]